MENRLKSLDDYEVIAKDAIARDEDVVKMYQAFDDMENCKWSLPPQLANLPGMRTIINTEPADAIKAATRIYANNKPVIELSPLNPYSEEASRMEIVEQVLDWHFDKLNRKPKAPLYTLVHDAIKYMRVAFQVEYYPHLYRGRKDEPKIKNLLKFGDFGWKMHDPKNIHAYYDGDSLDCVINCSTISVKELINRFGEDNEGISKMLTEMRKDIPKGEKLNVREKYVTFCDYTDWTYRVVWCYETTSMDGDKFEIMRKKHGLPFINWVFVVGDNPLLKSVYDSNAWDDANLVGSLRHRLIAVAASHPAYITKTNSKQGVDIDYDDGVGTLDVSTNEDVQPLEPRRLDPHLTEIFAETAAKIRNTSGTKYLQNLDFPANTPFASINALITASMANLGEAKKLAETAIAEGMYLNLKWIAYAKEKSFGLRTKTASNLEEGYAIGSQIGISGTFDNLLEGEVFIGEPDDISIDVSLRANDLTDKQMRLNMAVSMSRDLQVPISRCHEEMGLQNSSLLIEEWQQEQITKAELGVEIQRIQYMGNEQIKNQIIQEFIQQQQAQAQQQQQAQQGAVAQNARNIQAGMQKPNRPNASLISYENMEGEGFNGGQGGQTTQSGAPQQTREVISGKTQTGEERL